MATWAPAIKMPPPATAAGVTCGAASAPLATSMLPGAAKLVSAHVAPPRHDACGCQCEHGKPKTVCQAG
jgi:hypothetical protein